MNKIEKLKQIMSVRKMGYEETARELGVSFQTIYRWFNKGQKPCKWTEREIDKFIKKYGIDS